MNIAPPATTVDATTVKRWLSEPPHLHLEIAFVDVREAGQFGEGHPFFAIPLPYSRFEIGLPALAPNPAVRLVLCDAGDGVSDKAAARAQALGYSSVHMLDGGIAGWRRAGYTLFAGVNLPSKTFGEIIEHARHTPRLSALDVEAMRKARANMVIVDGRPLAEYRKMAIPGGICCPNGELALRIGAIAPDPATTIVVNCAGRTRSIIGAQTLIELGVPNPVYALENGTQGWFLAGLELERGADRRYPDIAQPAGQARARAAEVARAHGVPIVAPAQVQRWLGEPDRTTYLLDVRTAEDVAARPAPGFTHAPGGQLVQATDQWIGVKGGRIALLDDDGARAPVIAAWLRQLGHDAVVIEGGLAVAASLDWSRPGQAVPPASLPSVSAHEIAGAIDAGDIRLVDLRPSMSYRASHARGAVWATRSRLSAGTGEPRQTVLVADEPGIAELAAVDLAAGGDADVRVLAGGHRAWVAAGLPVESTPAIPADADCIDFLFFVHDRHDGNADAARRYLAWETGLLAQLDDQERGVFRIQPT